MYNYRSTTYSRDFLPQIKNQINFTNWLKRNKISFQLKNDNPNNLSPIQQDFDRTKINSISSSSNIEPIIVSSDKFILDGHHRWAACQKQKKIPILSIDKPIHELVPLSKRYEADSKIDIMKKTILESINNKKKNLKRSIRYEQITIID